MFRFNIRQDIKASKEFVFDWWTDLQPEDSKLVKPLKSRKIISRTPKLIILEDEESMYFRKMKLRVKVTLERPDRWVSEYDGKIARARSTYTLTSSNGMTHLDYQTEIYPNGFLTNLFSPLVKYFVKRIFQGEFKVFIKTLEDEYIMAAE